MYNQLRSESEVSANLQIEKYIDKVPVDNFDDTYFDDVVDVDVVAVVVDDDEALATKSLSI